MTTIVFYKRNPAYKTPVGLEGISFDDDTIAYGEEFKKWSENKTSKGPFLIPVTESEITPEQRVRLEAFTARKMGLPPRHMGAIKSDVFRNRDEGLEVKYFKTVDSTSAPVPEPEPVPEKKEKETPIVVVEHEDTKMEDAGNDLICDSIMGITEQNVEKVKSVFVTFEKLSEASNAEMRSAGIRPNYFSKVREAAKSFIKEKE